MFLGGAEDGAVLGGPLGNPRLAAAVGVGLNHSDFASIFREFSKDGCSNRWVKLDLMAGFSSFSEDNILCSLEDLTTGLLSSGRKIGGVEGPSPRLIGVAGFMGVFPPRGVVPADKGLGVTDNGLLAISHQLVLNEAMLVCSK